MPTEKNAAFLPMQYGFKLDRQRVKCQKQITNLHGSISQKAVIFINAVQTSTTWQEVVFVHVVWSRQVCHRKLIHVLCNWFYLKFSDDNNSTISERCIYQNKRGTLVVRALSDLDRLIKLGNRVKAADLIHAALAYFRPPFNSLSHSVAKMCQARP